jgi:FkbM family methyltransferase
MIKNILQQLALQAHIQHDSFYSRFKVNSIGIDAIAPLTSAERNFYLNIAPAVRGQSLIVYDIGAAKGVTASCFAKLRNVQIVHAFEPIQESYRQLIQATDSSRVVCHNIALGSEEEVKNININNLTNSSSLLSPTALFEKEISGISTIKTETINIVKLDDYVERNSIPLPQLMKIDVQGYEKEVIIGGIKVLRQTRYCFMEMSFQSLYEGTPLFDDLYQLMVSMRFKLVGTSSPMFGKSGQQLQVDGLFVNTSLEDSSQ